MGGDDGQEYGYFLPPPPLPFLRALSLPILLPSSPPPLQRPWPPSRPPSGPGAVFEPPRRERVFLPVLAAAETGSECTCRISVLFRGKKHGLPPRNALQGMPVCFLHGKSTYCRQPFMQGNVVLQHFADNNFSDEARKTAKTFQKKISWRKIQKKNLTAHPMRVTMFAHTGLIL